MLQEAVGGGTEGTSATVTIVTIVAASAAGVLTIQALGGSVAGLSDLDLHQLLSRSAFLRPLLLRRGRTAPPIMLLDDLVSSPPLIGSPSLPLRMEADGRLATGVGQ